MFRVYTSAVAISHSISRLAPSLKRRLYIPGFEPTPHCVPKVRTKIRYPLSYHMNYTHYRAEAHLT